MSDRFEDKLVVVGLSDEQNEAIRQSIIDKLLEGETKDA